MEAGGIAFNARHALEPEALGAMLDDARRHTLALLADLTDAQLDVPHLPVVNPIRWEIGHVAFFYDVFVLGELGSRARLMEGDADIFDSFLLEHPARWEVELGDRATRLATLARVKDAVQARLEEVGTSALATYLTTLAVQHEDMHGEALHYSRHTLGYPAVAAFEAPEAPRGEALDGDVAIPGGTFVLGASRDEPFVFDNEKWGHDVTVAPFSIARTPVTNAQFAAFVDDGGYGDPRLWTAQAQRWKARAELSHPAHWRRVDGGWEVRRFDRHVPLPPTHPVSHVSWHEAEAYCRWAKRRLPTEAEWAVAASGAPEGEGLAAAKRRYPWGDEAIPTAARANVDGVRQGTVDVSAFPEGDSAFGCRQMIGNVWEWTSTPFFPFPGFVVDRPYREYSAPWFGYPKVLRGGSWATRGRLARNGYRNFFWPDRHDVIAGFRTCAISS